MTSPTFVLTPLSLEEAEALREQGGKHYVADSKPGFPCRRCLRDAEIGAEMLLLSHDPFEDNSQSPYRSASPIFLHLDECGGPVEEDGLPSYLTVRELSVRAFDNDDMIIDATVIPGTDLQATIDEMLANDLAEMLHVHNAQRGCYAVKVNRI